LFNGWQRRSKTINPAFLSVLSFIARITSFSVRFTAWHDRKESAPFSEIQFAIDFGNQKMRLGSSTAILLELYSRWVKKSSDHVVESEFLHWFNRLDLADESKV